MKRFLWILAISLLLFACGDDSSSGSSEQVEPLTPQEQIDDTTTTSPVGDTSDSFTDPRDGKTYKTVTMGKLTWMAENLNYADEKMGQGDERYTWAEAQVACPDGWHLPTISEWDKLRQTLFDDYAKGGKDSTGWAIKSASGWENDTTDGGIVSGNGGNVLGFDIKPTGICFGSSCIRQGVQTGFWTQDPRIDDHAYYIAFERTANWVGVQQILMDDARLHVRCVSDENSIFAKLGKCTSEKEGVVVDSTSGYADYYTCKENIWSWSTDKERLDALIDSCDATRLNERRIFDDVNYTCVVQRNGEYTWKITTEELALEDCLAKGDTVCRVGFSNQMYILRDGSWERAYVYDVFGQCTEEREGEIVKFGTVDYICRGNWDTANSYEIEYGYCDDSRLYDTVSIERYGGAIGKAICEDRRWREPNLVERMLGFCFDDGAVGEFDGLEYVCDPKDHNWYYEMTDGRDGQKYKAVWISGDWAGDMLVMAEDLKYGGDSLYTWAEAQVACPDGWHVPSDRFIRILKEGYLYWNDRIDPAYKLISRTGWNVGGSNSSGLNLRPIKMDTVNVYVYIEENDSTFYDHDNYKLESWFWLSDEEGRYAGVVEHFDENGEEQYMDFYYNDFDPIEKATVRCVKE